MSIFGKIGLGARNRWLDFCGHLCVCAVVSHVRCLHGCTQRHSWRPSHMIVCFLEKTARTSLYYMTRLYRMTGNPTTLQWLRHFRTTVSGGCWPCSVLCTLVLQAKTDADDESHDQQTLWFANVCVFIFFWKISEMLHYTFVLSLQLWYGDSR